MGLHRQRRVSRTAQMGLLITTVFPKAPHLLLPVGIGRLRLCPPQLSVFHPNLLVPLTTLGMQVVVILLGEASNLTTHEIVLEIIDTLKHAGLHLLPLEDPLDILPPHARMIVTTVVLREGIHGSRIGIGVETLGSEMFVLDRAPQTVAGAGPPLVLLEDFPGVEVNSGSAIRELCLPDSSRQMEWTDPIRSMGLTGFLDERYHLL